MKLINKWSLTNQLLVILSVTVMSFGFVTQPQTNYDRPTLALPAECSVIQAPAGASEIFRTYAIGVQLYRWNGTDWAFVAPVANLYADAGFHGLVGTHYAGPTWESNSGSKVVASRVAGCSVDQNSIDWLLLRATTTNGPGPFKQVTFIQRVNTVGGKGPQAPGLAVGQVVEVPYTTEYFFYKGGN